MATGVKQQEAWAADPNNTVDWDSFIRSQQSVAELFAALMLVLKSQKWRSQVWAQPYV